MLNIAYYYINMSQRDFILYKDPIQSKYAMNIVYSMLMLLDDKSTYKLNFIML